MISIAGLLLVSASLWMVLKYAQYKKHRQFGIPSPNPVFPFGNNLQIIAKIRDRTLPTWRANLHKDLGPVIQEYSWFGKPSFVHVDDPDLIEFVTVKNNYIKNTEFYSALQKLTGHGLFSELNPILWKQQRRTISHAFSNLNIRHQIPILQQKLRVMMAKFDQKSASKQAIDIDNWFIMLTLDFIGESAFGVTFDTMTKEKPNEVVEIINNSISTILESFRKPWVGLPFHPKTIKMNAEIKQLRDIVRNIMTEHRAKPKDEENSAKEQTLFELLLSLKDPETGVGLSDETIVDNIITFLFAGHDTTAHSMAFTIYELCKNPEILKKAREEIDVVLAYDKIADASHMGKLEYLEMIVKESLRKHPSAGGTGRVLEEDYDYNGLLLPKGSKIFCSAVTMHNNEKYYPEPEKFIPERFTKEAIKQRPAGSYLPFSRGPRDCIGKNLAMAEELIVLSTLLKQFDFTLVDGFQLDKRVSITVGPTDGVMVHVSQRQQ
jgi:cytochrome P450